VVGAAPGGGASRPGRRREVPRPHPQGRVPSPRCGRCGPALASGEGHQGLRVGNRPRLASPSAGLLLLVSAAGDQLDAPRLAPAIEVARGVPRASASLALIAPLTAGGGNEVVPPTSSSASRPAHDAVRRRARARPAEPRLGRPAARAGRADAYLTHRRQPAARRHHDDRYVASLTVGGQALAWLVVGCARRSAGARGQRSGHALLIRCLVVRYGRARRRPRRSPTRSVSAAWSPAAGDLLRWGLTTGILLTTAVLAFLAGPAPAPGRCAGRATWA
jgi:hypothetical protein